jgi:hypothetical protein
VAGRASVRDQAQKVGVRVTDLSKIENGQLDCGDYPAKKLMR